VPWQAERRQHLSSPELRPLGIAQEWNLTYWFPFVVAALCHAQALPGRAERALTLARNASQRGAKAWGLRLLGEVDSQSAGDLKRAAAYCRQALALAEPRGMRPLVAHCHFGLGKLYWRTGKRGQAHERLTTARALYREMDMRHCLEQAEAEMAPLR
jgi:hypothetical protein